MAEHMVFGMHDAHGLPVTVVRFFNVYGPRQNPFGEAGVVAIFARQLLTGQPCTINGDGLTTRDYVHVSDVADAFVRAVGRGHGLINVASARERTVLEIHDAVRKHIGGPVADPRHGPALPGEVRRVCLDIARAAEQLGWWPRVGLDEGVGTVVTWLAAELRSADACGS
jgi:UDP-glucose 4-epimerase